MNTNTNAVLAQLRHLYANMMGGAVRDTAQTKRMAQGLLAPAIEALEQAALTTAAAVPPEGWVMVPREATDAMVQAAHHIDLSYMPGQEGADRAAIYRAMLAAAPKAEPSTNLADEFTKELDQLSQRNYELRMENATLRAQAAPQPAVQQGDELPREDFAWLVVQEACETEPADEDDPECIRILRRDLKSAVLSAFLRHDAAHPAAPVAQGDAREETNIGKAVNRAARDLPEGWEIRIDLERHAGVVHLIDPEGNETMIEGGGELFSDQISTAIDAARSQAKEGA